MTWKPKIQAKVTKDEALHAKSLLPPNAAWFIGVIEEFAHIQYRGAMHPNKSGEGSHPGVEVWTDIPEDQVGSKLPVVGYSTASPEEVEMVLQAVEQHGFPRDEIYSALKIESGWKPNALNPVTHAVGLFQIMPTYLDDIGFAGTWQDFQKLSAGEQAEYAGNYFGQSFIRNKWKYPGDTYVALAAGGFVGKPPGTIVYKKGSKAVEQNKLWDLDKSGDITVDELRNVLLSRMKGAPAPVAIPKGQAESDRFYSREEWLSLLAQSLLDDANAGRYVRLPLSTSAMLKRYQMANGLKVDGVAGPLTLGRLLR